MNPPGKSFEEFIQNAPEGRYHGIERTYGAADVARLRGSVQIRHTLAERGANRLWELLHERDYVNSLGAMSGNQAMQQVRAGLEAIYLSGWQVAADANTAGAMYPDQSLYPANSGPELVRKINRTLQRADQIEHSEGGAGRDWFAPIVADAEAGFGENPRLLQVRLRSLPPHEIGIRRVVEAPGDARLDAAAHPEEAFRRPVAFDERMVPLVDIGGKQLGAFRIGAADDQRRGAHHVGGEPRGV